IWDADSHQVIGEFDGHKEVVFGVAWHPDGQRVALAGIDGRESTVKVWNARTKEQQYVLTDGPEEYTTAAFSPRCKCRVTRRNSRQVQVGHAQDGRKIGILGSHSGGVQAVVFSGDGRRLASAGHEGSVHLWDAAQLGDVGETGPQKPLRTFPTHIPGV